MADNKLNTATLLERLLHTNSIVRFIRRYNGDLTAPGLREYLQALCREHNVTPAQVIKRASIERTFGHQIFNGRKSPSRDKVIQLAFGFGLNYAGTQDLLKAARKNALYPKDKRDAIIIYGLANGMDVETVQEKLAALEVTMLGGEEKTSK
jgi:transcriptional regulator with XRE-family HTH domain